MHDRLGHWLRKRFDSILDKFPKASEIRVRSTDWDRTLNSAQANLAGLYYLEDASLRYNVSLPYTPVPVHTRPAKYDKVNFNVIYFS